MTEREWYDQFQVDGNGKRKFEAPEPKRVKTLDEYEPSDWKAADDALAAYEADKRAGKTYGLGPWIGPRDLL